MESTEKTEHVKKKKIQIGQLWVLGHCDLNGQGHDLESVKNGLGVKN